MVIVASVIDFSTCREYDQARRAYLFALKCDSKNEMSMRELISLQMHLRDFAGLEDTSRKLLLQKPSAMLNWVTYASGCYANRNYQGCLQAVESMLKFQEDETSKSRMKHTEVSEICLLALRSFEAKGNF